MNVYFTPNVKSFGNTKSLLSTAKNCGLLKSRVAEAASILRKCWVKPSVHVGRKKLNLGESVTMSLTRSNVLFT